MEIKRTSEIPVNSVKMLVYGESGAGKTRLCSTLPNNIILSAESGLLSLKEYDLPYIIIDSIETLREAYLWVKEEPDYSSVSLDSISEIAEVILSEEKSKTKDGRQAYGNMQDTVSKMIRLFRDLQNKNVYFTAKCERTLTESGALLYGPSMPGKKLTGDIPYFFDEVLALRVKKTDEGIKRMLQCEPDDVWLAKDRSGKLGRAQKADLGEVIKCITS